MRERNDLIYQAFNALLKTQGIDAVGMTLKVAAVMSKIQSTTEGIEQPAPDPVEEVAKKRAKKNGRSKEIAV